MKIQWFKDHVATWPVVFSDEARDRIARNLLSISEILGGDVYAQGKVTEQVARAHALRVCGEALNYLSRRHAHHVREGSLGPMTIVVAGQAAGPFDFVVPATLQARVDLSSASREELQSRLRLEKEAAQRLLEAREARGFLSAADLERANVDPDLLGGEAFFGKPRLRARPRPSRAAARFLDSPTFNSYLAMLAAAHALSPACGVADDDVAEMIEEEIHDYALALDSLRRPAGGALPGTLLEEIIDREEKEARGRSVDEMGIDVQTSGVLLDDAMYPAFVSKLVRASRTRIWVIMFFARFEDEPHYPTDELFRELADARGRGVDVRVILDMDAEDSVIGSRSINRNAYEYLKRVGVAVVFDSPDEFTHTKLVLVDEENVVIGSHNWTAGSFFAYQDTSVFVASEALAAFYRTRFEDFWRRYAQLPPAPVL